MGKVKVFTKVEMSLPTTGFRLDPAGVLLPTIESIPPEETRVEVSMREGVSHFLYFAEFYGTGFDIITFVCQYQMERFVAGEDLILAPQSIMTLYHNGLRPFFGYLMARSVAEEKELMLTDINREMIDGYIDWLKDSYLSVSSQHNNYSGVKNVLTVLGRRGLIQIIQSGDYRTFPKNPFPHTSRSIQGEKPLPKAQRQSVAKALREAVMPLFHPDVEPDSYLLTVALLVVALHTGRNTTPLLEMSPDCLRPHPKAGTMFLVVHKRRGRSTHKIVLNDADHDQDQQCRELAPTVRTNVATLIRRIIELTETLRAEAPTNIQDRIWLFRSRTPFQNSPYQHRRNGEVTVLQGKILQVNIGKFVANYALKDADGNPLRLNVSRLRKTFINRIFEILDGDIVTTAVAAGHAQIHTTDTGYLRAGENATKNWKFMGHVLTSELLDGTVGGHKNTPVAGCTDPNYGQYAPKRDGATCTNFLNCLRCRNYVVTGNDLYKLFSFQNRILKERNRMDKRKWKKHYGHIPRLVERDVIKAGIDQKKFKPADVESARLKARNDPHPFWKVDALFGELEELI